MKSPEHTSLRNQALGFVIYFAKSNANVAAEKMNATMIMAIIVFSVLSILTPPMKKLDTNRSNPFGLLLRYLFCLSTETDNG